jgi:5S rRNA maturation endonuclease (ribonuclease M5)
MMQNSVQDAVLSLIPGKRKQSQSGWWSFNAVCCHHRGERQDTRGRGGIIPNGDGKVSYSCFNCGYKASYQPGRPISHRFKALLRWMGADEKEINRLIIEALRLKDLLGIIQEKPEDLDIEFEKRELPKEARTFTEIAQSNIAPKLCIDAMHYISNRGIDLAKYDFYWTPIEEYKYSRRVIIPFYWKNEIVGFTARTFVDGIKPKYQSSHAQHFVFNIDKQLPTSKFVIVCEGPFDAMSVDGVAVLTNNISAQQADIIDALDREVIVVPDWDKAGKTMIDRAIENGWSVSFPIWKETCKDINDAVIKYGKLFVLKSILDARESNSLKIKLLRKN